MDSKSSSNASSKIATSGPITSIASLALALAPALEAAATAAAVTLTAIAKRALHKQRAIDYQETEPEAASAPNTFPNPSATRRRYASGSSVSSQHESRQQDN